MRFPKPLGVMAALLLQSFPTIAADAITNLMSPVVSYQYAEDSGSETRANGGVLSPFVSFQYFDALTNGLLGSPIVSYQYFEWPGDSILALETSPLVSYFYLSWGAPSGTLGSSSEVTASPSSVPADGRSPVRVAVRLLDGNGTPVAGKSVTISAVEQTSSGAVTRLATITQPASPTDASGLATATMTSQTPGTVLISAQDVTDCIWLNSPPTVQFTPAFVPPGQGLSNAIAGLASEAGSDLSPYLANLALDEGRCGDYFQNQAGIERAQQGAIALSAGLGGLLALVPLEELLGPSASALDKAFFSAEISSIEDYNALSIGKLIEDIAGSSTGLSLEAQDIGSRNAVHAQALSEAQQGLSAGVPPASASASAEFAIDLGLRTEANRTIKLILISQDTLLSAMQSDSEFSSTDFLTPLFTAADVIGAALGSMAGGVGGIVAGETINAIESGVDWEQNRANLAKNTQAYLTAVSALISCVHFSGVIYSNAASGLMAVAEGRSPNPVTGSLVGVASQLAGPEYDINGAWAGADPVTTPAVAGQRVTGGVSLVTVENTGKQSAAFTAYAVSQHTVSLRVGVGVVGVNVGSLPYPQLTTATATIPAGQTATLRLNYFDGVNGTLPDSGSAITIYVLGHNDPDFFNVGKATSTLQWRTSGPVAKGQTPSFTFENPIKAYVFQSVTNQAYQAQIQVANPFAIPLSATVTQPLPPGITILGTDGALQASSIVWSNTIATNGLAKDSFSFTLFVAPGAQTNLPPATVVFTDATGTNSLSLDAFAAPFSGLFPVGVSGFVPNGTPGAGAPMQLAVTNWTGATQTGTVTIVLTNSAGAEAGDFSLAFDLPGSGGTNLEFHLPGAVPPGPYSVTGWLGMSGGTGQVISGTYLMPRPPQSWASTRRRSRGQTVSPWSCKVPSAATCSSRPPRTSWTGSPSSTS